MAFFVKFCKNINPFTATNICHTLGVGGRLHTLPTATAVGGSVYTPQAECPLSMAPRTRCKEPRSNMYNISSSFCCHIARAAVARKSANGTWSALPLASDSHVYSYAGPPEGVPGNLLWQASPINNGSLSAPAGNCDHSHVIMGYLHMIGPG